MDNFIHPNIPLHSLQVLQDFLGRYKQVGAKFISLPWTVPDFYSQETNPHPNYPDRKFINDPLVSSGEQSFCYLSATGKIGEDLLYMGWTPCFRSEEKPDETHHHYFLKAEAFRICLPEQADDYLNAVLMLAFDAFSKELQRRGVTQNPTILYFEDRNQFDIIVNGVELGSYGIRPHPTISGKSYIYATIVAEPRFSYAVFQCLKKSDV